MLPKLATLDGAWFKARHVPLRSTHGMEFLLIRVLLVLTLIDPQPCSEWHIAQVEGMICCNLSGERASESQLPNWRIVMSITRRTATLGGLSLLAGTFVSTVSRAELGSFLGIGEGVEDFILATDAYIYGYPLVRFARLFLGCDSRSLA